MKKRILVALAIFNAFFLTNNNVNAISCEYGDVKRDDEAGNTYTTKVTVNYDSGNYSFNLAQSPSITSGDLCNPDPSKNSDSKEYSCPKMMDLNSYFYSWKLDIPTEIGNEYFAQEKCPEVIYYYIYSKSTSSFYPGLAETSHDYTYLYTFSEEVSTHDDDPWWEFLTYDNITGPISYVEKNYYDYTPEEADKDHCLFWNAGYRNLERILAESGGSCDANQEFSDAYQKLADKCSRWLNNNGYTQINETSETSNGTLKATQCSKSCSALRDTVALMCNYTSKENCNSLGSSLLTWIYRAIKFVRYGIPALLIILSILDFIKAIASESDDEMKKVSSRFTKRLIAAALIFILPFILDFILQMFNIPGLNDPFCANS